MSTATLVYEVRRVLSLVRSADFIELTKPRIAVLVLITVCVGAFLASNGIPSDWVVLHALLGTAAVAGGASVFNHLIERRLDARMQRTENRPLPSGRITTTEATLFGLSLFLGGAVYLFVFVNALTALLGIMSWFLYVTVYTPLKSRTVLNTFVGAIPGALPAVMGWTAVAGHLSYEALALFLIVFCWQFPHFMAIAWMYRKDYAAAGMQMLPNATFGSTLTAIVSVGFALILIPISLIPTYLHSTGMGYAVAALILGAAFLAFSIAFAKQATEQTARALLRASLIYLPLLFLCLIADMLIHYGG